MISHEGRFISLLPFIYGFIGGWLFLGGATMSVLLFLIRNRFEPFLLMGLACVFLGMVVQCRLYKLIKSIILIMLITFGSGFILFSLTTITMALIIKYVTVEVLFITFFLLILGVTTLFFYYKKYRIYISEKILNLENNT
jgi:hypothetical protein